MRSALTKLCSLGICLMLFSADPPACAEISDQLAFEFANRAITKFHIDPRFWTVHIDKNLEDWRLTRKSWENWAAEIAEEEASRIYADIARIEAAITAKHVWLVVYNFPIPPGERIFHTHAIVFLDPEAGQVLAAIDQEGGVHLGTQQ